MSTTLDDVKQGAEEELRIEKIDFKMVTFSLAGKDYGIDIMKINGIYKVSDFTYVPNVAPFVRGVYNLRGEIISIIDLRVMFNLPVPPPGKNKKENMIVLRLENLILGVIVDSIDKVVGIHSGHIQPPHPLFGDINIRYISGVVDYDKRLYVILDVEKIFGTDEAVESMLPEEEAETEQEQPLAEQVSAETEELDYSFISETLATFKTFYVTPLNVEWVRDRYTQWKKIKTENGQDLQLKNPEDAEEYLVPFYSPYTSQIWGEDYLQGMKKLLPPMEHANINVLNPGCGKGFESYSLAGLLKSLYPQKVLKVWAYDSDLLSISVAPNLSLRAEDIPDFLTKFIVEDSGGVRMDKSVRDSVIFEYHDVLHSNPLPPLDLIVARDLVSFFPLEIQKKVLLEFYRVLKPTGVLILGMHEKVFEGDWTILEESGMMAFKKQGGMLEE